MIQTPADIQLWNEFKSNFERGALGDIQKALEARIGAGTIALTIVAMESLSGYHAGQHADRSTFEPFVRDYMGAYSALAGELYACVRNGLLHDYRLKTNGGRRFLITLGDGEFHLKPLLGDPSTTFLNSMALARDFLAAASTFFHDVETDQARWKAATQRLRKGFVGVRFADEFAPPAPGSTTRPATSAARQSGRSTPTQHRRATRFLHPRRQQVLHPNPHFGRTEVDCRQRL